MQIPLNLLDLPEKDLRAAIDEDALDELAASLRDHGQLQPIGVKDKPDGRFEVVFGSRRTRAAKLNAWSAIEGNLVADNALANSEAKKLIENVQRLDMTPMEEAYGLADLIGDGEINVRALQAQTGKSRDWIRTRLALINMPDDLQGAVQAGVLNIGVAQQFATIESPIVREMYINAAVENGCSNDQAKAWAAQAQYAEQGVKTMDEINREALENHNLRPPADLHYHCFICSVLYNWRRTNPLIVCTDCQDKIGAARTGDYEDGQPTPLDTDGNVN